MSLCKPIKSNVLFQSVGHEHQHLRILVEKKHNAKVAEALVCEPRRGHELQTLHLPEVRRVPKHVNVQKLRKVIIP